MAKTTEELVNEDGVLDERAAGEMIDEKMKQMNDELAEVAAVENDTLPPESPSPFQPRAPGFRGWKSCLLSSRELALRFDRSRNGGTSDSQRLAGQQFHQNHRI